MERYAARLVDQSCCATIRRGNHATKFIAGSEPLAKQVNTSPTK